MKWSVGIAAEADRPVTRDEIVELADAVAPHSGIATGLGTTQPGAQIVVEAGSREEAIEKGRALFHHALRTAGLPALPIARAEATSEDDE
jgi:hypothetical protein